MCAIQCGDIRLPGAARGVDTACQRNASQAVPIHVLSHTYPHGRCEATGDRQTASPSLPEHRRTAPAQWCAHGRQLHLLPQSAEPWCSSVSQPACPVGKTGHCLASSSFDRKGRYTVTACLPAGGAPLTVDCIDAKYGHCVDVITTNGCSQPSTSSTTSDWLP